MKAIFSFLILFVTSIISAQIKAPDTDFTLQYATVFWKHQYENTNMPSADLLAAIESKLKADPTIITPIVTGNNKITFSVDNDKPNIKKYGAKEMKTSIIAQLYMKYDAVVEVTENGYSVKLTKIFLDNKDRTERKSGEISKFICNTSNLTFKEDPGIRKGLTYVNRHFLEKFDVTIPATEIKK